MEWMLMPLKRYADFSGRSRRMEYWMWAVFQFLVYLAFTIVSFAVGGAMFAMSTSDPNAALAGGGAMLIVGLLQLAWWLGTLVPGLAVTVRRLHDTDRSGWWMLAPLAPYLIGLAALFAGIGGAAGGSGETAMAGGIVFVVSMIVAVVLGIVLLVFMFMEGTRGPNRFGPDPKQPNQTDVFA